MGLSEAKSAGYEGYENLYSGSHAILIDFFRVLLSRPPSITGRTNRWSPGCQFYASNWGPSQYRFRFGNRAILTGTAQIRLLVSSIISNINFLSQNSVYQLIIFFLLTHPPPFLMFATAWPWRMDRWHVRMLGIYRRNCGGNR